MATKRSLALIVATWYSRSPIRFMSRHVKGYCIPTCSNQVHVKTLLLQFSPAGKAVKKFLYTLQKNLKNKTPALLSLS